MITDQTTVGDLNLRTKLKVHSREIGGVFRNSALSMPLNALH